MKGNRRVINRRNFLRVGAFSAISATGAFSYARWIEPQQLSITTKDIIIPNLPASLDGLTIAHLTDFHYRPDTQEELISKAVQAVNAHRPDLIALTGDYITADLSVLSPLMKYLEKLSAKYGVYGIMGNHDGWHAQPSVFKKAFRQAGFDFLVNQGTSLSIGGEKLYILGTDSIWSGTLNLKSCYQAYQADAPVLALVHEPDVFDMIRKSYPVSLQLSGHTHGGQCRVPIIGYAPAKVKYGKKYIYGEYRKNGATIFVSRGLGTVGFDVRFACMPEVAILTLRSPHLKTK